MGTLACVSDTKHVVSQRKVFWPLNLHMSAQIRLREHEPSLVVLLAHDTLVSIKTSQAGLLEQILVLEVWEGDVDILPFVRARLEAHHAVPRLKIEAVSGRSGNIGRWIIYHVLDGEES